MVFWVRFYQKYLSPLKPNSCRYYPTCSSYAIIEFKHDGFFKAIIKSTLRILRCNQLFAGGIDHPKIGLILTDIHYQTSKKKIVYWFVPADKKSYFVIKNFKGNNV